MHGGSLLGLRWFGIDFYGADTLYQYLFLWNAFGTLCSTSSKVAALFNSLNPRSIITFVVDPPITLAFPSSRDGRNGRSMAVPGP